MSEHQMSLSDIIAGLRNLVKENDCLEADYHLETPVDCVSVDSVIADMLKRCDDQVDGEVEGLKSTLYSLRTNLDVVRAGLRSEPQ